MHIDRRMGRLEQGQSLAIYPFWVLHSPQLDRLAIKGRLL